MLCGVERLAAGFGAQAAGLEQMDLGTTFSQAVRQKQAGDAAADDAEAALPFPRGRRFVEIDMPGSSLPPGRFRLFLHG